jgi:hypothetical protein
MIFMWVWNLVTHRKGRTLIEGVHANKLPVFADPTRPIVRGTQKKKLSTFHPTIRTEALPALACLVSTWLSNILVRSRCISRAILDPFSWNSDSRWTLETYG